MCQPEKRKADSTQEGGEGSLHRAHIQVVTGRRFEPSGRAKNVHTSATYIGQAKKDGREEGRIPQKIYVRYSAGGKGSGRMKAP